MNIVVFGSTGGVGSSVVNYLKKTGHQVILSSRDVSKSGDQMRETSFHVSRIDLERPETFSQALEVCQDQYGSVDGVISCIGSFTTGPLGKLTANALSADVMPNVQAAFLILEAVKKCMTAGGSVVFTSSCVTQMGAKSHVAIGASKGAIEAMARNAAAELAAQGVRVNTVALGLTKTAATQKIWGTDEAVARLKGSYYPLGLNEPADVARSIVSILQMPNMTGQVITIDGGVSSIRT